MFKHALTQDVAYEGLLKAERQRLHARTAQAIEGVFAERIPEFVETLAYHYQRGGVPDKAVHYLTLAGRKCVARFALDEAERHYREAYALLPGGERTAAQCRSVALLLEAWSLLRYYRGSFGETHELLQRHLSDAERCEDPALLAMYLGWLGFARVFVGNSSAALEVLDRALAVARSVQSREALAHITAWRLFPLLETARGPEAIQEAELLDWSEEERLHNPYPYFKCRSGLAIALLERGDHRRAYDLAQELIAFGGATGNSRALSLGHWCMAPYWSADLQRRLASARACIDAAKDPHYQSLGAVQLAAGLLASRQPDQVLEVCGQWLPYFQSNGNLWNAAQLEPFNHAASMMQGRLSDGLRNLHTAIAKAKAAGHLQNATLGEIVLMTVLVSVARGGARPPLGVLVRNPWFVFTQAPFAARKAAALIEHLHVELPRLQQAGYLPLVDLYEAMLCAAQRNSARSRECLQRYRQYLLDAGIEQVPARVTELEAELDAPG